MTFGRTGETDRALRELGHEVEANALESRIRQHAHALYFIARRTLTETEQLGRPTVETRDALQALMATIEA